MPEDTAIIPRNIKQGRLLGSAGEIGGRHFGNHWTHALASHVAVITEAAALTTGDLGGNLGPVGEAEIFGMDV